MLSPLARRSLARALTRAASLGRLPKGARDPIRIGILGVLVLAATLYFYRLGDKSVWLDEAFTYADAQVDAAQLTEVPRYSFVIPPTWFILVRASLDTFGDNDTALRLVAAVFALLAVVAFAWCAATLFDRETALFAAFLLAGSPMMLHHAQEARPYSPQVLMNVLATVALWRLLYATKSSKGWAALLYALSLTAGFYVSYMSILVVGAHGVLVMVWLLQRSDERTRRVTLLLAGSLVFGAILCLPVAGSFLVALRPDVVAAPPLGPGLAPTTSELAARIDRNGPFAREAFWWANLYGSKVAAVVSVSLLTLGFVRDVRRPDRRTATVWCGVLLIVPVTLLLVLGSRTTWTRYYIVGLPWFLLLVGRGLTTLVEVGFTAEKSEPSRTYKRTALTAAVIIALLAAHVPAWVSYYRADPGYSRDKAAWKAVARYLEENWQPGELIIAADLHTYVCLGRYLPAILPSSFEEMVSLLRARGRGYVVDGGWRLTSDQLTIRNGFEGDPNTRLAFSAPYVRLYEWGAPRLRAPATIQMDLGSRTREMFLKRGWHTSRYRLEDGRTAGIIENGAAAVSFIVPAGRASSPARLRIEMIPFVAEESELTLTLNGNSFFQSVLQQATIVEASLSAELLREGSNVLEIRSRSRTPPAVSSLPLKGIMPTDWPADVAVHAVGGPRGDFAWIFVDGRRYSWEDARRGVDSGYTVMVLAEDGTIEDWRSFNTCCARSGESAAARLAEFIDGIPNRRVVLVTSRRSAGTNMTAAAVAALRTIGAEIDPREQPDWVHGIVGIKGLPAGLAAEVFHPEEARIVLGPDPEANIAFVGRIRVTLGPGS